MCLIESSGIIVTMYIPKKGNGINLIVTGLCFLGNAISFLLI